MYIDPGTGSMLFTVLLGALGAGVYGAREVAGRLRLRAAAGKNAELGKKRVPLVIYTDDKRYWNVFEPICRELEERGQEAVYYTSSEDDPGLTAGFAHIRGEYIGKGDRAFALLNRLNADVVLSSTPGLDVYQWKRSKNVGKYVHIPHAPGDITRYRMFGLDFYDAVLLSGEYQVRQLRELEKRRHYPPKELVLTGITYLDAQDRGFREKGERGEHLRTVLLAPSWGESGILSRYGERMIQSLLDTGYRIIVRPHPQSFQSEKELIDRLMAAFPESDRLTWNRDNDNFEVLWASDILISDFSGVMFDYALVLDRPVIYADTSFDKSPYDAWWLEEELWTFETLPRIGRQLKPEDLEGNLKTVIDECADNPAFREGRERARKETWMYRGEAARRTAEYLVRLIGEVREARETEERV